MASHIGFVVAAMFLSLAYGDMIYALLALAAGLRKVTLPQTPKRARRQAPHPWTTPPLPGTPQFGEGGAGI